MLAKIIVVVTGRAMLVTGRDLSLRLFHAPPCQCPVVAALHVTRLQRDKTLTGRDLSLRSLYEYSGSTFHGSK
jgi:hypothetical protein